MGLMEVVLPASILEQEHKLLPAMVEVVQTFVRGELLWQTEFLLAQEVAVAVPQIIILVQVMHKETEQSEVDLQELMVLAAQMSVLFQQQVEEWEPIRLMVELEELLPLTVITIHCQVLQDF